MSQAPASTAPSLSRPCRQRATPTAWPAMTGRRRSPPPSGQDCGPASCIRAQSRRRISQPSVGQSGIRSRVCCSRHLRRRVTDDDDVVSLRCLGKTNRRPAGQQRANPTPAAAATPQRRMVLTGVDIQPRRVAGCGKTAYPWARSPCSPGARVSASPPSATGSRPQITLGCCPATCSGPECTCSSVRREDSWEHTILPRLVAAGAALTRVHRVEVLAADDIHVGLSLPRDLPAVRRPLTTPAPPCCCSTRSCPG